MSQPSRWAELGSESGSIQPDTSVLLSSSRELPSKNVPDPRIDMGGLYNRSELKHGPISGRESRLAIPH